MHVQYLHPLSEETLKPNSVNLPTSMLHLLDSKNLLTIIFSKKCSLHKF
jgi:hypothetical protein